MDDARPVSWLSKWERRGLAFLVVVAVVFGGLVEFRSAFLKRRMGDVSCFFRCGWVVRTGGDLYDFVDDNGWHYNYPPLFAILMVPLADPPPGTENAGTIPFKALVAIWYWFGVACMGLAIHLLASAVEATSTDPRVRNQPWGCRRWWLLRLIPFLACLAPIGHTLMRGQVNLLLLLLLCGAAAASLRGQHWRSGLWLAGAICLKVIPAFLLLFPLWRRDYRCLAGCALGLLVGLVLIPAAVFGLPRTVAYYEQYVQVLLGPALGVGSDRSRAGEIIESTSNDSQSLQAAIHNSLNFDRSTRPPHPSPAVRWGTRGLAATLTLLTLLGFRRRRSSTGPAVVLFFGALILLMLLTSPLCHTHYYCLAVPVVMGMVALAWEGKEELRLGSGLWALAAIFWIVYIMPNLPGLEWLRDLGLMMYPGLLFWLAATVRLWKASYAKGRLLPFGWRRWKVAIAASR